MPLADVKGLQITSFLSLLKRDDIICNPPTRPFFNASGPLCNFKSSHQRANRKQSKGIASQFEAVRRLLGKENIFDQ